MQLLNELLSAFLQVIVFTFIPFIFFLFRKDKGQTFVKYIGFIRPTTRSILYVLSVSLLFVFTGIGLAYFYDGIREAVLSPNSVTGKLRLMGFGYRSALILLIIALLKTSLSEEIFFRGFLAKRFINSLGFSTGNMLQALIFGLIHLLLFWTLTKATIIPLIILFIFSSLAGWTIGYVKEKYANGCFIPGWIAHGLGNMISYLIIAYVI